MRALLSIPPIITGLACGGLAVSLSAACHHVAPAAAETAPEQQDERPGRYFPGVEVVRMTGGGVRIRLIGAFSGNRLPLYLVDGGAVTVLPGGGIEWLDLDEIVSIEVLKDPARTAQYGPRGANGVLLITTKVNR